MRSYSEKMVIMRSVKNSIAATRIQRTWRSFRVELYSGVERQEAKLNKLFNFMETRPTAEETKEFGEAERCSSSFFGKGRWLKGPPPALKRIHFHEKEFAEFPSGIRLPFQSVGEDAQEKSSCIFTLVVNSWINRGDIPFGQESFFEGFAKKWVDSPSSKDWMGYLSTVIELLDNREVVRLWGDRGGTRKIYPNNKGQIVAFRKHFQLYLAEKRLVLLKSELRNRKMNRAKLNPMAECFTPMMISQSSKTSRNQHDELNDILAKFNRLLELHQPVCIATPL